MGHSWGVGLLPSASNRRLTRKLTAFKSGQALADGLRCAPNCGAGLRTPGSIRCERGELALRPTHSGQSGGGGAEDFVDGEFADAVAAVGVGLDAGGGGVGQAGAGELSLQDGVAVADGAPDGGVLRAEEGDDGRADGGGDVHGAAVVAEKEIELREERGELAGGEALFDGDEVGAGVRADFGDKGGFAGAGDDEDLGVEFVLKAVAHGGEAVGGPEAEGAAAAGMEKNF